MFKDHINILILSIAAAPYSPSLRNTLVSPVLQKVELKLKKKKVSNQWPSEHQVTHSTHWSTAAPKSH